MAYELIETIELTASAASIEFTSIPQDGVDLLLVCSLRVDSTSTQKPLRLNSDTNSASYDRVGLFGSGSSASTGSFTNSFVLTVNANNQTADTFSTNSVYISNYTASQNKSISVDGVNENNATGANQRLYALVWKDTSAVTSLTLDGSGDNFVQYSTASLYKVS